jgi:hypothetical protein
MDIDSSDINSDLKNEDIEITGGALTKPDEDDGIAADDAVVDETEEEDVLDEEEGDELDGDKLDIPFDDSDHTMI